MADTSLYNPIEWFAWAYGKFHHPYFGGAIVMVGFALIGLVLWIRGVDRYNEEHPANQSPKQSTVTATSTSSASQTVTDNRVSDHGMPANASAAPASTANPRKAKNTAEAQPKAQPVEAQPSETSSRIGANNRRHAAVVIGNNDSTKVANNYVEGGISAHGDAQDTEIRKNNIGGTTAGLENAGKAERILLSGNTVQPSAGNPAQIIKNDPGGEIKDVMVLNNEVKAAPIPPPPSQVCAPGASCAISSGQKGGITAVTVNLGPPPPEIHMSSRRVAPTPQYGKNAMEFTLTTNQSMIGGRVLITCENKIKRGVAIVMGGYMSISPGGGMRGDNAYESGVSAPNWAPQYPLVVTLYFDEDDLGACTFKPL